MGDGSRTGDQPVIVVDEITETWCVDNIQMEANTIFLNVYQFE